ncbi:MAG: type II secretion system secretin GspD [Proteobacteria bacterium]|nr:type II secretion system secretin GspD [Pseudomonadota bacterium]MBU1639623.1 type II secretion system secretin GspD [Pseudomonadota bacterium]
MNTLKKIDTPQRAPHTVSSLLFMASLLLFVSGCADFGPRNTRRSLDLQEIGTRITKQKDSSNLLVHEESADTESTAPSSRDFKAVGKGNNPNLTPAVQGSPAIPTLQAQTSEAGAQGEDEKPGILLNFDNADIYEVIQVLGDALGLNYIIDPQVKGVVNIRSARKIPTDNLYAVFQKILHMNGLDIRNEGSHDYIYAARKPYGQEINSSADIADLAPSSRLILQIVPVMHLAAQEATKLIEPYLSEQGAISTIANQNTLVISDYESKIIDVLTILARLDVSPLANLKIRLVRVENAPLFDLRDEVMEILGTLQVNTNDFEGIAIQPLERISSLLLVSQSDFLVKNAEKWVKELDVMPGKDRDNIYIYNARNTVATELADLVNSLIQEETPTTSKSAAPAAASAPPQKTPSAKPTKTARPKPNLSQGTHSSLRFAGTPLLLADDTRNIIMIRALPPDYARIVRLLERLDNLPRQVLVEVIVAEITLTDDLSLGVEWAILNNKLGSENGKPFSFDMNTFGLTSSIDTALNLVVQGGSEVKGLLKALAGKTDLSILSSPQVLVLNNETATVNVGEEVPIVTTITENEYTSGSDVPKVDKTIQYKNTGVILEVTPQINYDGIIILDVKQTVSKALPIQADGVQSNPIRTRELKTKFAVKDGQSILIGGLIGTDNTITDSGIPLLKDIPILGYFFKYENRTLVKTELLIMLTPYVIETEDVLDQYINEFQGKMNELRQELHRSPGIISGTTR